MGPNKVRGGGAVKTVRRLLYRDVIGSVAFVAVAFLSLFFFIDFVDELNDARLRAAGVGMAAWSAMLQVPGHLYELAPIAVLIGTIYTLASMAQSSEFTILRTAGLGPGRALSLLAGLGLLFAVLTFVVGDFLAPLGEREAVLLKARASGGLSMGRTGAWLKEHGVGPGAHSVSVNVASASGAGQLGGVRIFEFDRDSRLVRRIEAEEARVGRDGTWTLSRAQAAAWPVGAGDAAAGMQLSRHDTLEWRTTLTADVVAAAVLPLQTMSTLELWRYSAHLSQQEQAAQRHQIQFWKKALYPLACLVMMALALPFAYLHARAGGVSLKVFGGIMLGISFVLMNNLAGHVGMLRDWTPWISAAAPSFIYLLMSLGAFTWLVRYR